MNKFNILHFNKLESTNSYALTHLDKLIDRQVILADIQTAGYGRFKRIWNSDTVDNIYMSIVLKPDLEMGADCAIASLTQYMSVVLCDTLEDYNVQASIKWPNDILIDNKKIAGLLSETSICAHRLNGMVLGAGINLNMTADQIRRIDKPATSLNLIIGAQIDKDEFLQRLLSAFFIDYEQFIETGFSFIRERYIRRILFIDQFIQVNTQERTISGVAEGFTETGCLILQTEKDGKSIITAGDVIL